MLSNVTKPLVQHAPEFDNKTAVHLAERLYGLTVTASDLPSERDQNFLLTTAAGEKFVLKIANSLEDEDLLMAQSEAMMRVGSQAPICQQLIPTVAGNLLEKVKSQSGDANFVRLATYLEGKPLGEAQMLSPRLLNNLGSKLARMDSILLQFDRPSLHRRFHWDLANWEAVVGEHLDLVNDVPLRELVRHYTTTFTRDVAPLLPGLRRSCIHGDPNDYNVIMNSDSSGVVGFIDFGDMVYSYTVADLAIAIAYVVLKTERWLTAMTQLVSAYHAVLPLHDEEMKVLWGLTLMRLSMSVCLAAYQQQQQPQNQYLDISQEAICAKLPELIRVDQPKVSRALRQALR